LNKDFVIEVVRAFFLSSLVKQNLQACRAWSWGYFL